MKTQPPLYEIVIEGQLDDGWSEWLECLTIQPLRPNRTLMRGILPDQAALFGVLKKLHHLGLVLVSVRRIPSEEDVE